MQCIQGSKSPLVVTHKRHSLKRDAYQKYNNQADDFSAETENYQCGEYAVHIRNLCKRYDNGPPIVQNLCMNARKGTIYGLLGSSGCGKTTVLSFIVGLRKWDSGELFVFGEKPGSKESGIPGRRLGYMPQDIALHSRLSIKECIQFYGRIYNMPSTEITNRSRFLIKLLELPNNSKPIKDLSGGQKRRASLALALIHSPELIVLDEPTVGIDPLLRRSIWNHLYKIVSTLGTTIIITTHYIEEARLSNTIGVMRQGRLLVEDTPVNLLQRFRCDLLKQVVLTLCRRDESQLKSTAASAKYNNNRNKVAFRSSWNEDMDCSVGVSNKEHEFQQGIFRKTVGFYCDINQHLGSNESQQIVKSEGEFWKIWNTGLCHAFQRTYGLAVVIMMPLIRTPLFMVLAILTPSIQASIFLIALACKPIGLHIGILNYELANWTQECDLPKYSEDYCELSALSCKYLNHIGNTDLIVLDSYEREEDALAQVALGKSRGYLKFPYNYTQHILDFAGAKEFATNESMEGSRIEIKLDQSDYIASSLIIKHLYESYLEYIKHLAISCKINEHEAVYPLHFRAPVYGYNEDNFTAYIMPGAFISCIMTTIVVLTAVIIITDRKQGTLSRARVAGLATADVMMGYMLSMGIFVAAQIIVWKVVINFAFDFHIFGSQWLCVVIYLIVGLCAITLGMLLGILCEDEADALIIVTFMILVLMLYGGVIWPSESMAKIWQYSSFFLPTTLPIMSLRSVTVRGLGLDHILVWPGILSIIAWIVVLMFCCVMAYRRACK